MNFLRYSNSSKSIKDKYIHLTNYSINKNNANYKENNNDDDLNGHKWYFNFSFKISYYSAINKNILYIKKYNIC